jgi:hypothetical protein
VSPKDSFAGDLSFLKLPVFFTFIFFPETLPFLFQTRPIVTPKRI